MPSAAVLPLPVSEPLPPPDLMSGWSLEMTAKDIAELEKAAGAIPSGTRVSVTFLPGEDEAARVRAAVAARRAGFIPVPHLSARRLHSRAELERYLSQLNAQAGVDHVFVVAGDLAQPAGPFNDALGIIQSGVLEQYGITHVGISGYPEGHPGISKDRLWRALDEKTAALREHGLEGSIMTQFGFEAAPILNWLQDVRRRGITLPVWVGVPGPASVKTLLKFAARCGVNVSARVLGKYGLSLTRLLCQATPAALVDDLGAGYRRDLHGELRLHLYPFGGLANTVRWIERARG